MWELDHEEGWTLKNLCFWSVVLRVPWTEGRSNQSILKKVILNIHCKDWCWSFNSLAIWCKGLTHWKRPWCWERLKVGEGDDGGWDGWMVSPTQWTWVWVYSRVGDGQVGLACCSPWDCRIGHDWVTKLNWGDIRKNQTQATHFYVTWEMYWPRSIQMQI